MHFTEGRLRPVVVLKSFGEGLSPLTPFPIFAKVCAPNRLQRA